MKRKIAAGILSIAILAGGSTVALGATNSASLDKIKSLYNQMFDIQKQIVDEEASSGVITSDQASAMKQNIEQRQQFHDQAIENGQPLAPGGGFGMGGRGGMFGINNGQPPTQEQIDAWNKAREERYKLHQEAIENGTFVPGQPGQGFGPGMGMGGRRGGNWGGQGFGSFSTPANPSAPTN